jgi:phospholipid/cholesterol/gamma-HCH transport system substrate-binding protein
MRQIQLAVVICVVVIAVSGCQFAGPGSLPLPFTAGTGDGAEQITVQLPDASKLVPNSEVKVADVTVGTVTRLRFKDWHAEFTVSLAPGTRLPSNAVARVAQKSLLGATYLELSPPSDGTAMGTLHDGDVIPLTRSSAYPDTEQLLTALSVVLNGGGLNQIQTITTELNRALGGRELDVRTLVSNTQDLVTTLDTQHKDIVTTLEELNRFSAALANQRGTLANALDQIPKGLAVLNRNRDDLTQTLTAMGKLGDVADRVINSSRDDVLANLRDLQPSLGRLADSGRNLTQSFAATATFPWSSKTLGNAFRGDYTNLWLTLNVTPEELRRNWVLPQLNAGPSLDNPLLIPLRLAPRMAASEPGPAPAGKPAAKIMPGSPMPKSKPLNSILDGGR